MRPNHLLLCAFALACASPGASTAAPASPPSPAPVATGGPSVPSTAPPDGVRITAPACGYGGSATAVAVFVDVETDVALSAIAATIEAIDPATRAHVGDSTPPFMTQEVPPSHPLTDFSTSGTTPFSGALPAGARTRLLFFSGLDGTPPAFGPLELRVTITAAGPQTFEVVCTTDGMWPSS